MPTEDFDDFQEEQFSEYTYDNDRACEFCGRKIPDQAHATRRFCVKTKDALGNVRDCKTDYHREKEAPDKLVQTELINFHKGISNRIRDMVERKGLEVSTLDLDAYDIPLNNSIEYQIKPNGELISTFLEYTIHTFPITGIHKIISHE